ncbi:MAG: oxidoreductase [Cyanobacteria bacterium QS_8_64_29]|nr:MAG: oxidoreductase [Cyanobacteria bacterium QS_8_64_29]
MFLVTGATGQIGRRIVRQLRDADRPVRAFVRLTSHYEELERRGAEIFVGDLREDKAIRRACQGARYVVSAHGSGGDATQLDYRANIELIDRARESGVEHFVFISVLGADRGYQDSPTFKAKREVEKYLQASGLNYTILRPSGLASNLLPLAERFRDTGLYIIIGDPQNRTSIVSTDDLAQIATRSVTVEAARNRTFAVGGPEILQRGDIPEIFARVFQREPWTVNVPLALFDGARDGLGLINPELQRSLGTLRVLSANEFFCTQQEVSELEATFGLQMESLEQFVRRYLVT